MENLKVGDIIVWVSAAGELIGKVSNINLGKNANNELVPWIVIDRNIFGENKSQRYTTRLCGTDSYLKSMKVKVVNNF